MRTRHGGKYKGCENKVQKDAPTKREEEECALGKEQRSLFQNQFAATGHGAHVKKCSHEGCTNLAIHGDVCWRHWEERKMHGAKHKTCSHEGCTNLVIRGGVCGRHGAKRTRRICNHEGCTNIAVKGGLCTRHGEKDTCNHEGCNNVAKKWGVCCRHGAKRTRKICNHEGCANIAVKGRVCWRHGAKAAVTMDAIELRKIKAEKGDYVQDMKSAAASALLSLSSSCAALQN